MLVAELRIKQRLALALDHLSQWSLCWRPVIGMDAASLHISESVRAPLAMATHSAPSPEQRDGSKCNLCAAAYPARATGSWLPVLASPRAMQALLIT